MNYTRQLDQKTLTISSLISNYKGHKKLLRFALNLDLESHVLLAESKTKLLKAESGHCQTSQFRNFFEAPRNLS